MFLKGKLMVDGKYFSAMGPEGLAGRMGRRLPFVLNVILGMISLIVTWQIL